jgi:hypothetical protein
MRRFGGMCSALACAICAAAAAAAPPLLPATALLLSHGDESKDSANGINAMKMPGFHQCLHVRMHGLMRTSISRANSNTNLVGGKFRKVRATPLAQVARGQLTFNVFLQKQKHVFHHYSLKYHHHSYKNN